MDHLLDCIVYIILSPLRNTNQDSAQSIPTKYNIIISFSMRPLEIICMNIWEDSHAINVGIYSDIASS